MVQQPGIRAIKKQMIFVSIMIFSAVTSFAQFGLQVGWNTSGYKLVRSGLHKERGWNWGVNAGVMYRLGGKHLAVQPTLLYTQKGATNENTGSTYTAGVDHYKNKLNYIEFSIPVLYKIPFARKCSFDIGAGPYIGSLVAAVSKIKYLSGKSENSKFKIGTDSTDDFKRNDIGMSIYVGTRFHHFNMFLAYDKGFRNISAAKNETIRNGCFSLNLGVLF